jgi:DnaJ-class molecular chaperone
MEMELDDHHKTCPICNGAGKIIKCICKTISDTGGYRLQLDPKCRADHSQILEDGSILRKS